MRAAAIILLLLLGGCAPEIVEAPPERPKDCIPVAATAGDWLLPNSIGLPRGLRGVQVVAGCMLPLEWEAAGPGRATLTRSGASLRIHYDAGKRCLEDWTALFEPHESGRIYGRLVHRSRCRRSAGKLEGWLIQRRAR